MPTGGRQGGATSRASLPATGQAPSPPPAAPAAVDEPATATPAPAARIELSENNATEIWSQAVAKIDGMAADQARRFDRVCAVAADRLSVHFRAGDSFAKSICEQPPNLAEFEKALSSVCGGPVRLDFVVAEAAAEAEEKKTPAAVVSPHLRLMEVAKHPMICARANCSGPRQPKSSSRPTNLSRGGAIGVLAVAAPGRNADCPAAAVATFPDARPKSRRDRAIERTRAAGRFKRRPTRGGENWRLEED